MATLSSLARKSMPKSEFGLPGRKAYPMPDKSHAANAKARATQQVGKSITSSQRSEIDAKANAVLGKGAMKKSESKMPTVKGATTLKQAAGKPKTQAKEMKTYQARKSDPWDKKC